MNASGNDPAQPNRVWMLYSYLQGKLACETDRAFRGLGRARSRIVVFCTDPGGAPSGWTWEYIGVLADRALTLELGGERLVSANISRARDGALLLITTPESGASTVGRGCAALELASLDPPAIRRNADGSAFVRAVQTATAAAGWLTGAWTYDSASLTGIITVAATTASGALKAELQATGLRP